MSSPLPALSILAIFLPGGINCHDHDPQSAMRPELGMHWAVYATVQRSGTHSSEFPSNLWSLWFPVCICGAGYQDDQDDIAATIRRVELGEDIWRTCICICLQQSTSAATRPFISHLILRDAPTNPLHSDAYPIGPRTHSNSIRIHPVHTISINSIIAMRRPAVCIWPSVHSLQCTRGPGPELALFAFRSGRDSEEQRRGGITLSRQHWLWTRSPGAGSNTTRTKSTRSGAMFTEVPGLPELD
ncbi:hypothetical protein FB45DRAFT_1012324 [Roridomyces roridus]|uniref:Uncharacterized protein n=1 Tax=Roridomyces roridus TaxID=1738132 RepID=A0AAD7F6W2_9AGAR|nr:hypothetical protein FB45DRAFT_1012324 [Roridomyces roridus]